LNKPILTSILQSRVLCAMILGVTVLQLVLVGSGLPGWQSPIHTVLGIPDPGCGLSRATVALLSGNWRSSLTFHAFAPFLVAALSLIAITTVLPARLHDKAVTVVEGLETQTGLTAFLLIGLVIYWLARLLIMGEAFINLVAG
jgi:hypothetical protein